MDKGYAGHFYYLAVVAAREGRITEVCKKLTEARKEILSLNNELAELTEQHAKEQRKTALQEEKITGQRRWPETRSSRPGECVYSEYWLGKQRQCMTNWREWLRRRT